MGSEKNVKVSVIIPIYNQEKYLMKCMESVILQDLKEIEVICVNDGSTDSSSDILSGLSWSDERIIVIDQKNMGVGEARNRGIREAAGEYIAFMDPDDWYYDFKALETLYNKAKENNALICGGSFTINHEKLGEKDKFFGSEARYTFSEDRMYTYREYQYDFGFHRFIYDRKMILENNLFFPNLKRFQDPVWFVQTMHSAGNFFGVTDKVYAFRSGHKINVFDKEKVSHIIEGITQIAEFAKSNGYDCLLDLERMRLIRGTAEDIYPYISEADPDILKRLQHFEEVSGFKNTQRDILINIIKKRESQLEKTSERLKEQENWTGQLRMENGAYKRLIDSQRSELEQIGDNLDTLFTQMGWSLNKQEKKKVNILPFPYVFMEQDMDGVKWKVRADGSIEANGKAEADTQFTLTKALDVTDFKTAHRRYRISTGAPNTSAFTWYLTGLICNKDLSKCLLRDAVINGTNGFSESFDIDTSGYEYFGRLFIVVKSGQTLDHVIFRPEISLIN